MSFTNEYNKQSRIFFLDVQIICVDKKKTSVYRKPTFSGVYTHFRQLLPSTYKFGTICKLAYRYFWICLCWTKLHTELLVLNQVFLKNGYPENFINKYFKRFMENIDVTKATTPTVEKKPLVLVLPHLASISLHSGTKLKKSLRKIL